MRRGFACLFITAAVGALTAVGPTREPALSAQARDGYRLAVEAADSQLYTKALARLDGLLMRSVTIGIDVETIPSDASGFAEGVKQGVAIWSTTISDSPFKLAAPGEAAAMQIRFVDEVKGSSDVQGMITARREFQWSKSEYSSRVSGTIQVVRHTNGRNLTRDEVSEVVAHELGHLLGLDDVEGTVGLMGAFVGGEARTSVLPTEREVVVSYRTILKQASAMVQQRASSARRVELRGSAASPGSGVQHESAACACANHR